MPHPLGRTAAQRGADAEHVTVITGGGPNRPRIIMDATAAWVEPPGGGGGWNNGLVPACLRIKSVRIVPLTAAEAIADAVGSHLKSQMVSGRRNQCGRVIMETGSDPASVRPAQTCGNTAATGIVGRAYALVHGGRDPVQHAVDTAGAQMVGSQWLVSKTDALLPHRPLTDEDAERGWPFVYGRIVVDLKQLEAIEGVGTGALPLGDIQRALASTERLIKATGVADAALAVSDPVEAVALAVMLGLIDMERYGPSSEWSKPLGTPVWNQF